MNIPICNHPVASNIIHAIEKKGMKQYIVADRVGFPAQCFNDMLNGRRVIKACDIPRIAAALDLTPNDLYGISEIPERGQPN